MDIQHYVESLGIAHGTSRRMDCPACGRKNTFSVTNNHGQYLWNCFHASCDTKGRTDLKITADNAANMLSNLRKKHGEQTTSYPEVPFEKPKCWSRQISQKGLEYVDSVHTSGRYDDIYYDCRHKRLVYAIRDRDGKLVDGAGRTLINARPKWYRYGNYRGGFSIGTSKTVFVVEDIPSAISISDWVTGYALLGTNLRDEHIQDLAGYDNIIVALDKDATDKALTMMRVLNRVAPTGILMLDHDLKTMGDEERGSLVRSTILGK